MKKKSKKLKKLPEQPKFQKPMPIEVKRDLLNSIAQELRGWAWDDTTQSQARAFRAAATHCDEAVLLISLIIESQS